MQACGNDKDKTSSSYPKEHNHQVKEYLIPKGFNTHTQTHTQSRINNKEQWIYKTVRKLLTKWQ